MNKKTAFYKYSLASCFRQPLFYITAILFSVFVSINYFFKNQFFTGNGNTDLLLFFSAVPYICIIAVPALCLKNSSYAYDGFVPLSSFEKLIIRELVILTLFVIMTLLLLPACLVVIFFGSIDPGQVFTGLLFLIFYGSSIICLCFFISLFFTNGAASYIVSAVLLGIFNTCHLFTVYVDLPDFAANFFKTISFAWHFDAAGKGIIDTRDLFWFISIDIILLITSKLVLEKKAGRQQFNKIKTVLYYTAAILVLLNSSRWYLRFDLSKNKTYTMTNYTKQLVKKIDSPLKITFYKSGTLSKLYPQIRDVSDLLVQFSSQNKNISLTVKNPDKSKEIQELLEGYGINSQQLRTVKNNSTEYVNVYSAISFEYEGNVEIIPFILSADTLEYDMAGRVLHLLTQKKRLVNVIIGNEMNLYSDEGYSLVIPWLNSQGFICNPLEPSSPVFQDEMEAAEGPLLVIGDSQISAEAAIIIENYILNNKGNALFMVSPYSSKISDDWSVYPNSKTNIIEMLENWGIYFKPQIAADINCARITMYSQEETDDMFTQGSTYTKLLNYPMWINIEPEKQFPLGCTLFWATPIEFNTGYANQENDYILEPLLKTSQYSYAYDCDLKSPGRLLETNPFVLEEQSISDKEKKIQCVGAKIQGDLKGYFNDLESSGSTVYVIPDQYFVNTLMTGYIGQDNGDYRNFDYMTTVLLELNDEKELAELKTKQARNTSLYKIFDTLQFVKLQLISYLILFLIIPCAIVAIGIAGKKRL